MPMSTPRQIVRAQRRPRGDPSDTYARIVAAAAIEFEQHGFYATDTNRIARAAGYAPATFYKHFDNKLAVFLAVYDTWVEREWEQIDALAKRPGDSITRVRRIVDFLVDHHRRWRGFRAALRALTATETAARNHHAGIRRDQVARFRALLGGADEASDAVLLLLYLDRVCDAIALGELRLLGVAEASAKSAMVEQICAVLDKSVAGGSSRTRTRTTAAALKPKRSKPRRPRATGEFS
jgi:AcrR family transcriptional regulator